MAETAPIARKSAQPPFEVADVRAFVARNAATLKDAGQVDVAEMLEALDIDLLYEDLEQLEQHLTAIEQKMIARLLAYASEDALLDTRRALGLDLKP